MLRRNSAWPGASMRTKSRDGVRNRIWLVSRVMPWSRSVCSASSRNDHSNGRPRRALTALRDSNLPSGRLPVSYNSRPIKVDLPWSTCPTMTMRTSGRLPAGATAGEGDARRSARRMLMGLSDDALKGKRAWLQIAGNAQTLERLLGLVVHGAAGGAGGFGAVSLQDD